MRERERGISRIKGEEWEEEGLRLKKSNSLFPEQKQPNRSV